MEIKNLSFAYSADRLILKNISMTITAGEFVCILGQSGCVKSTFLRLLAGLERPTTGQILSDGQPIKGASLNRGVVFQEYGLFPWMTAGENIMLALLQRLTKQRLIKPEEYAEVTRLVKAEGYNSLKVDPIIFSDQPDGKGPWKIRGPLEHRVIKTVYDHVAAMREAGGDDMAHTYDCSVQIHVCGSPISKAAALQIEAAIPNFLIHEHHQRALNPESRASCLYDYQPVNGVYEVPDRPGIGQDPTAEAIAQSDIVTIKAAKNICNIDLENIRKNKKREPSPSYLLCIFYC